MRKILRRAFKDPVPPSKSSSDAERYGLFPLNENNNGNPNIEVDIVAVHGLGGHYLDAWTDRLSDGKPICWLKDFIPRQFGDRARILSFGYDSQTAFSSSVNTIEDTARGLLTAILHARTEPHQINRPLIFIAHSLGGIIFKKALVIANENTERFGSILENTKAAILFAVPHRGSDLAFWSDLAASLLHSLNLSNPQFIKALRSKSKQLQIISEQSVHRLKHLQTIMTFYESNKMNGRLIVDKDSAVLHCPNENLVQIPSSNHATICKFSDYESQKYKSVRSELQRIVDEIVRETHDVLEPFGSPHRGMSPTDESSRAVQTGERHKLNAEPYDDDPISRRAFHFVARHSVQHQLEAHFASYRNTSDRPIVALIGMGGAGKTQIAIEYCRIRKEQDESLEIFWVDASSSDAASRVMMRIARKLLPDRHVEEPPTAVTLVRLTLSRWNRPWLLVFDNLDRPSEFEELTIFFPNSRYGSILITSRDHQISNLGRSYVLSEMDEAEALRLLLGKSPSDSEKQSALQIVNHLGRLPLAIDQARAYISECNLPLETFISEYNAQKHAILGNAPPFSQYKRTFPNEERETVLTVVTTWEMSFSQLNSPEMRAILTLLGFFHPSEISENIFALNSDTPQPDGFPMSCFMDNGKWNHIRFRSDITYMRRLSLLQFYHRDDSKIVISIHPLVSEWLRIRIDSAGFGNLLEIAMLHMQNYITSYEHQVASARNETLLHVVALSHIAEEHVDYNNSPFYEIAHTFGSFYRDHGHPKEAKRMYDRALAGKENAWGPNHTSTLDTVNSLSILYCKQGRLEMAEKMYDWALAGYEKAWGPNHTSTLDTVNNLGLLYADQGRLEEAEQMYDRALAGYEKAWGPNHTSTLDTVNNLGNLYKSQVRLEEAEQMYDRALAGKEKAWGPNHTSTLDTVHNLGFLYANQGRLEEAEQMYHQALAGCEKAWGPNHTSTLTTVNNLGILYADRGRLEEAEQMYDRALAGKEKAWGPNHTSTLMTVNNLGVLYKSQGRLEEAEQMYDRALAGYEEALGPHHTLTLGTVYNLGLLYKSLGRLEEAEKMFDRKRTSKLN